MKILITLLLLFQISCASKNAQKIEILKFIESSGKIEITLKGSNWQSITSSGSADVIRGDLEQAMNVATIRAKANIVEFMENKINSNKSTETTISKSEDVTKIMEKISSDAQGILKYARVIERKVSGEKVLVTVKIEKRFNQIFK